MTGILAAIIGSMARAFGWSITAANTISSQAYQSGLYAPLTNGSYFFFKSIEKSGLYARSTDGLSWNTSNLPASDGLFNVSATNGSTLIVCRDESTTSYYTSTDGTTWTTRTHLGSQVNSGLWDGTRFWLSDSQTFGLQHSLTGTGSWTRLALGFPASFIAYNGSRYLLLSAGDTSSHRTATTTPTNSGSWSSVTLPSAGKWVNAVFGNGTWVAFRGNSSSYGTSTNGTTWTSRSLPSVFGAGTDYTTNRSKALFYDGKFYYVNAGILRSSTDGITWTTVLNFSASGPQEIAGWAVGPEKVVATGYSGTTATSRTLLGR